MKVRAIVFSAALFSGSVPMAFAQTAADINTEATRMNNLAGSHGESNVIGKISNDFNSFLGSDANTVVTGLRNGTPITLTRTTTTPSTTPGGAPVTTTNATVITPPTGQMGHGNVYISLALAKQQLSQMGINEPTPQQLQAALTGGSITQTTATGTTTTKLQGILTMRSEKMGWGKIAQELGTKLGPVMSSMKSANHHLTNGTHPSANAGAAAKGAAPTTTGSSSSTVSGSGKSPNANSGHGHAQSRGSGSGIVTASGRSGGGHAYGRGGSVVSGSGSAAGSHGGGSHGGGAASGGGSDRGGGHGKGHGK
jgi:hypothetical protein